MTRMWHMPTISVVVATYNRPKTLYRLLDIINNQLRINMREIDVCVVDDGSEKDLTGTFPEYRFKYEYVYRPRGNGSRVYSSRNIAVARTNGEIIIQMDDDVTFHERTLSEIQNMGAILQFTSALQWNMSARVSNLIDVETPDGMGNDRAGYHRGPDGLWRDGKVQIMQCAWPSTSSMMMTMPRTTWDMVGGYDEDFDGSMGAADQELALRISKAGGYLMLGPYFANIEDEETGSHRMNMINSRPAGRMSNEDLMRLKHPDMDFWSQVDGWDERYEVNGCAMVYRK